MIAAGGTWDKLQEGSSPGQGACLAQRRGYRWMGLSQGLAAGQGLAAQPSECHWLHFLRRKKSQIPPHFPSCLICYALILAHSAPSTLILPQHAKLCSVLGLCICCSHCLECFTLAFHNDSLISLKFKLDPMSPPLRGLP